MTTREDTQEKQPRVKMGHGLVGGSEVGKSTEINKKKKLKINISWSRQGDKGEENPAKCKLALVLI